MKGYTFEKSDGCADNVKLARLMARVINKYMIFFMLECFKGALEKINSFVFMVIGILRVFCQMIWLQPPAFASGFLNSFQKYPIFLRFVRLFLKKINNHEKKIGFNF